MPRTTRNFALVIGRIMLEAHRELASIGDENAREFEGVIRALQAELEPKQ